MEQSSFKKNCSVIIKVCNIKSWTDEGSEGVLQTHRECPEVQALHAEMLYFPQFQELPHSRERNAVVFGLLGWNQHLHKKILDK